MSLLLAEELVLLCMDDETGQCLLPEDQASQGVARALIFELTLRGTVTMEGKRLRRDSSLTIRDELLALAADRVHGKKLEDAVEELAAEDMLHAMLTRLVTRGILHDAQVWESGQRHLPRQPHHEARVRERLSLVLQRGSEPSRHDQTLIALLQQFGLIEQIFAGQELSDEDARNVAARAATVAEDARPTRSQSTSRSSWWDGFDLLEALTLPLRFFD